MGQWHLEVFWQESKSNWYAPYQMFEIEVFSPMWWSIVWNLTWQFRASWPAICDPDRCQLPSLNPLPADTLWRNVVYLNPIFIQLDILENTIWPLLNKQWFLAFKSIFLLHWWSNNNLTFHFHIFLFPFFMDFFERK